MCLPFNAYEMTPHVDADSRNTVLPDSKTNIPYERLRELNEALPRDKKRYFNMFMKKIVFSNLKGKKKTD